MGAGEGGGGGVYQPFLCLSAATPGQHPWSNRIVVVMFTPQSLGHSQTTRFLHAGQGPEQELWNSSLEQTLLSKVNLSSAFICSGPGISFKSKRVFCLYRPDIDL